VEALDRICVSPDACLRDALGRLGERGIVLVLDQGVLQATLTDGDVRRALLHGYTLDTTVSTAAADTRVRARPAPVVAPEGISRRDLLALMRTMEIRHVPIINAEGRVLRVVTVDTLRDVAAQQPSAVIMAGGEGRRLRPLTENVPKPMLPIEGRPLLERIIEQLRDGGVTEITLCLRYLADVIIDHFGDGSRFGVSISYTRETAPMGTGGALSMIERPGGPIIVMNGDILTDVSLSGLLRFHQEHEASITLGVRRIDFQPSFGVVETSGVDVVTIRERPVMHYFANAGLYLLTPETWDFIPPNTAFDMPDLVLRALDAQRRVISFPVGEDWVDIGEHATYARFGGDTVTPMTGTGTTL